MNMLKTTVQGERLKTKTGGNGEGDNYVVRIDALYKPEFGVVCHLPPRDMFEI